MNLRSFSLVVLTLSFILGGCNYTRLKDSGAPEGGAFGALTPSEKTSTMNFAYIYAKVLGPKCVSCHGDSGNVNLESYENVFANQHAIHQTVFVEGSMPKKGTLSAEEKRLLWHWLNMGCPKESVEGGEPKPTPPVDELLPTYDSINQHIIQQKCVSCHSKGEDAERVSLEKDALLNSPLELVLPGNPDESGLVIAVERTDEKRMPLSTEGYGPLTDKEKSIIREWIQNGAKD